MRDIKFRAISSFDEKTWKYGLLFKDYEYQKEQFVIQEPHGGECNVIKKTISQYTGLKDAEGKEIYEEDILECGFYSPCGDKPVIGEIIYRPEEAGFMLKTIKGEIYYFSKLLANVLIIGNKFENPDLLEDANETV